MDGKKKELDTGIQFFQIESFAVNFIFIDTGEECDAGFFEVSLSGGVYEAHGEDFSFKSFLPASPFRRQLAISVSLGAGSAMLLGKV
jgi:hypothetical protein